MFRLSMSHLQELLKYTSKVNNVHNSFWDPKCLHGMPECIMNIVNLGFVQGYSK